MDAKPGAPVHEPLLAAARPGKDSAAAEDDDGAARQGLAAAEVNRLVRLGGPIVASCILQNVVNMVSVMVVGHLGELPLAGASLATSLANVTGYSLLAGMATALDTLCGQAYGARMYHRLGVYKQRAMVVLSLACVPIVLIWVNTTRILVFLGQDPAISAVAGEYARWTIPSLLVYVPLQCHIRFLQSQTIVLPVTASSGATALCHPLVCWLLVFKAGLGSKGAALSNAVSYGINLVILALYVRLSATCKNTWSGFSREAFKELRQFTALAMPSAMMICLEWWSFEVLVLLSGLLPNPQLETSVLSICLNTGALLYMVPLGLSSSISTRVSNELGAGHPEAAKLAMRVVMYMALSVGFVLALTMILLRNVWGYLYSNEQEIVTYMSRMLPVLGISFFIDGLHSSLSGVLTGSGKQNIGAAVNLGAFYLLGIPMAVMLAFVFHLNGMGLWLGIVSGSFTKLVLLMFITWCIDWQKEALKAQDRVLSSSHLLPVS
ncbi:protein DETOXIFICATION 16-like [Hordeum vulgare subsp. vulgare]|uniref:Protein DETOXIFICATION n=1 Tax=Hordeum vulgare subsp. vulgare TaxID=112509 RepID=A0A8I6Z6D2_HORVV|nr:protein DETOXIFICATION 16-like [Hordeum vulgare subsp. vulgare]